MYNILCKIGSKNGSIAFYRFPFKFQFIFKIDCTQIFKNSTKITMTEKNRAWYLQKKKHAHLVLLQMNPITKGL